MASDDTSLIDALMDQVAALTTAQGNMQKVVVQNTTRIEALEALLTPPPAKMELDGTTLKITIQKEEATE